MHFGVWSEAERIELCLFDGPHGDERERIALRRNDYGTFSGYVAEIGPGQHYGYRAHGPYAPAHGDRFNPNKLLLDPYAQAIDRPARFAPELLGYANDDPWASEPDPRDSAAVAPRCIVIDPRFEWGDDARPRTPWARTVIYECHIKGMTALHPLLAPSQRGTYLGLCSEPVIAHLRALGVTAVQLLPIQHAFHERFLVERGLVNYWGYNTVGFFAPDVRFAAGREPGAQVSELKTMVRALHAAGIEVILDVVYNHSGEADALGPTLSLRGLANAAYYKLDADRARYADFTGCGNTLELSHPRTLQLVADSLRHFVREYHVDGFRFDLASALVRGPHGVEPARGLFALIAQDPLLREVKLIVEPWDASGDGYRVGGFPAPSVEWNDRYRDGVRKFWRGDAGTTAELITRLAGSSDLFDGRARTAQASLNYVTCHDGFCLRDLTSYAQRHNLANGWNGLDGASHEASSNYGHEGPSTSTEINTTRARIARSMFATLACSLGVPMLREGDELGHTQHGNNNPYNQDNETTWLRWDLDAEQRALLAFCQRALALRAELFALRRTRHFDGQRVPGSSQRDVTWLDFDGHALRADETADPQRRLLAVWLCGHDAQGEPNAALPSALLLLNASTQATRFSLPALRTGSRFVMKLDSAAPEREPFSVAGGSIEVSAHALCALIEQFAREPTYD